MRNVFPHYGQPVEFSGRKKLDVVEIYRRRQIIPLRTSSFSRYVLLRLPCEYPIYIYIYMAYIYIYGCCYYYRIWLGDCYHR